MSPALTYHHHHWTLFWVFQPSKVWGSTRFNMQQAKSLSYLQTVPSVRNTMICICRNCVHCETCRPRLLLWRQCFCIVTIGPCFKYSLKVFCWWWLKPFKQTELPIKNKRVNKRVQSCFSAQLPLCPCLHVPRPSPSVFLLSVKWHLEQQGEKSNLPSLPGEGQEGEGGDVNVKMSGIKEERRREEEKEEEEG